MIAVGKELEPLDRAERLMEWFQRMQGDSDYEVLKDWRYYGYLMKHGKTSKIRRHAKGMRLLIAHLYMPTLRRVLPKWRKAKAEKGRRLAAQIKR